jgi:RHS repeat-associated protein
MQKRLQAVTDGAGQLIAIADSAGEIDASYAGSGYGQTSWRGAGVMTRGQTFSPRRWETDAQWGDVQQFRNRAYDPGSGRWLQEDPIGVAGGINLYEYNGNDPVTWRDPFGLMPGEDCKGVAACLAELGRMTLRGFAAGADPTGATPFSPESGQGQAGYLLGKIAGVTGLTNVAAGGGTAVRLTAGTTTPAVVFKSTHGSRHLAGTGLAATEVEGAIRSQMNAIFSQVKDVGSHCGTVCVRGTEITYRSFKLPDGVFSVGTYFPKQ